MTTKQLTPEQEKQQMRFLATLSSAGYLLCKKTTGRLISIRIGEIQAFTPPDANNVCEVKTSFGTFFAEADEVLSIGK
jgi:hypothetical protein